VAWELVLGVVCGFLVLNWAIAGNANATSKNVPSLIGADHCLLMTKPQTLDLGTLCQLDEKSGRNAASGKLENRFGKTISGPFLSISASTLKLFHYKERPRM